MNKKFDCVEMKHKAAEKIQGKLAGFTIQEELKFWKKQTESLRKYQRSLLPRKVAGQTEDKL